MIKLSFLALLLLSCGYAALRGGRDGRWAAFMLLAAALLTIPASWIDVSWSGTHMGVFGVDVLLLLGLFALAMQSASYWPIWMVALHLVSVATHLTTAIDPRFLPKAYQALASFWSLPMQLVMPFGIMLDRAAGLLPGRHGKGRDAERR